MTVSIVLKNKMMYEIVDKTYSFKDGLFIFHSYFYNRVFSPISKSTVIVPVDEIAHVKLTGIKKKVVNAHGEIEEKIVEYEQTHVNDLNFETDIKTLLDELFS